VPPPSHPRDRTGKPATHTNDPAANTTRAAKETTHDSAHDRDASTRNPGPSLLLSPRVPRLCVGATMTPATEPPPSPAARTEIIMSVHSHPTAVQAPGGQVLPHASQAHQVLLYDRALHPEILPVRTKRIVKSRAYELEARLMHGSHALCFSTIPDSPDSPAHQACELFTDKVRNLPTPGLLSAFLAAGEHEFDHTFPVSRVTYMLSVQTEHLAANLYADVYREMLDLAKEESPLLVEWADDAGRNLSMISTQRQQDQVHAQAYHLLAAQGLVIRTQSIFEMPADE
jgi:hypothetical protein